MGCLQSKNVINNKLIEDKNLEIAEKDNQLENLNQILDSYEIQLSELKNMNDNYKNQQHNAIKEAMSNQEKLVNLRNEEISQDKQVRNEYNNLYKSFMNQYEIISAGYKSIEKEEEIFKKLGNQCKHQEELMKKELEETKNIEKELKNNLLYLNSIESNTVTRENEIKSSLDQISQQMEIIDKEYQFVLDSSLRRQSMINTIQKIIINKLDNTNNYFDTNDGYEADDEKKDEDSCKDALVSSGIPANEYDNYYSKDAQKKCHNELISNEELELQQNSNEILNLNEKEKSLI